MEEKKSYVTPIIMAIMAIHMGFLGSSSRLLVCKKNLRRQNLVIVEPNSPPPITAHVFPANDTWKNAYGDSDNTTIFFNLKVLQELIKNTNARVKVLEDPNEKS